VRDFGITSDGLAMRTEYTYTPSDQVETEKSYRNNSLTRNLTYCYKDQADNNTGRVERIIDNLNGGNTRLLVHNSFGQLENASDGRGLRQYDDYGNCISIGDKPLTYTRGHLLNTFDGNSYGYNHQGVRVSKTVDGVTTTYYLDGDKILGEDRSNGIRLRYVYDATGLQGFWAPSSSGQVPFSFHHYIKDALGNIVGIVRETANWWSEVVCHYSYNAFGEMTALRPDGTIISPNENHIANTNPFRWKGHYFDTETGFYYIDGKYYDPKICGFISVDRPENLLHNASVVGGLNRYGITIDNPVALIAAIHTIYTVSMLYTDIGFVRQFPWWVPALRFWNENRWIRIVAGIAFAAIAIGVTVGSKGAGGKPMVKLLKLLLSLGIAISTATAFGALGAVNSGTCVLQGALDGFANGIFFGGMFAVASVGLVGIIGKVKQKLVNAAKAKFVGPPYHADLLGNMGQTQPKTFDVMQFDPRAVAKASAGNPSETTFRKILFETQEALHPGTFDFNSVSGSKAPFINKQKVILHHPLGREGANLYNVVGVKQAQHKQIHAIIGYRNIQWLAVSYNFTPTGVFWL